MRWPGARAPRATGTFSCVVDADARFHLEALRWFAALTTVAGVDPADLIVHAIGDQHTDALEYLRSRGVAVRAVGAFDERSPHCNKIAGALSLVEAGADGRVAVLTDADVVVCRDPRALRLPKSAVASKIVDRPHPSLEVIREVFRAAGVSLPALVPLDFDPQVLTVAGNGNGGVYVIPSSLLPAVAGAWATWARWLLDRRELLDRYATYVDQLAMALALASEGIDAARLDVKWNFPTHMPEWISPTADAPAVMHYHQRVEPSGLLSTTGVAAVDTVIARVNAAIADVWRAAFPNRSFWEWRYATDPALGSGVGSRGEPLQEKRRLIRAVVAELRPASVLDVGCGDGEATRALPFEHYLGLDPSGEAIRLARLARPDGEFRVGTLTDGAADAADLTICLDVLIHQPDRTAYETLVGELVRSARRALLVSGYEQPPTSASPVIFFHEALEVTLRRFAPSVELRRLRDQHEITTYLVLPNDS